MTHRKLSPKTQISKFSFRSIVLTALFAVALTSCEKKQEVERAETVRPVKLFTVQAGADQMVTSIPGRVRAARRSELSFEVAGPLEKLPVDEGQMVEQGDLIAQIRPRDFQTAVNEAKAQELEAEQHYQRYKQLYAKRQVSKADFDRFRAGRDVARAHLEDAQNALKDTKLLAPFGGVVAKRYVENFEKVTAKQPIVFLQFTDQLEILVDVPELMMARFRRKDAIEIIAEFDALPGKQYPVTVKEFSTEADPATQTYQVVLIMDQPSEATILPGMTAKVTGSVGASAAAQPDVQILVPATAVLNDADQSNYVWVLDRENMVVHKTQVETGSLEGSTDIIVTKGLEGGEEIVTTGVTKLREDMKVRPMENQREGN